MEKDKRESSSDISASPVLINADNYDSIVERIFVFLEYGEWKNAGSYAEQALNFKPKAGILYLAKLMAELQVKTREELKDVEEPFDDLDNFAKACDFDEIIAEELKADNEFIRKRNEISYKERIYSDAIGKMNTAETEDDFQSVVRLLAQVKGYMDADSLAAQCTEKAEIARKNEVYNHANELLKEGRSGIIIPPEAILCVEDAITAFNSIIDWEDSAEKIGECNAALEELKTAKQEYDIEVEHKAEKERIKAKQNKKRTKIIAVAAILLDVVAIILSFTVVDKILTPELYYLKAISDVKSGNYERAFFLFDMNPEFKDTQEQIKLATEKQWEEEVVPKLDAGLNLNYIRGITQFENENYTNAILYFEHVKFLCKLRKIETYKDVDTLIKECYITQFGEKGYEKAIELQQLEVGDIFTFGNYYQLNSSKKEPVEWLVLEKGRIGLFVVSKNVIDSYRPSDKMYGVLWKDWELRNWLNNTFLNNAFNKEEQRFIGARTNYKNNEESIDKIRLLWSDELFTYKAVSNINDINVTEYTLKKTNGELINIEKGKKEPRYWQMKYPRFWLMPEYNENDDGSRVYIYNYAGKWYDGDKPLSFPDDYPEYANNGFSLLDPSFIFGIRPAMTIYYR